MRAFLNFACLFAVAMVAAAGDKPPDISREPLASWHRYIDHVVIVRGHFSLRGKVAPFIDTGKTQVYLMPENRPDFDVASEGKEMAVLGTLHYQREGHSSKSAVATNAAYFYLAGDCAFSKPSVL
jgi:hypothetical protein